MGLDELSVVIPWRAGDDRREQIFKWIWDRWNTLCPEAEIIQADSGSQPFHRGESRNQGAHESSRPILCFADADTTFNREQIERAVALIDEGAPWVLPYGRNEYYNLTEADSDTLLSSPVDVSVEAPADWEFRVESWAGVLLVPRDHFDVVHGYDPRFCGWGGEDNAFRLALDVMVGGHTRLAFDHVCHIWHPRGDAGFEQPDWPRNARLLRQYARAKSAPLMEAIICSR